jgi:hypothetical protein
MTLLNAPAYDPARDIRNRNLLIGAGITLFVAIVLALAGYMTGHGWLFTNLPAEHRVDNFFTALEAKDYDKAYGIYFNDPRWLEHPQRFSQYPLKQFTEDWTAYSPIKAPVVSHHVDISRTDGSGPFGTGIIVAVRLNGSHKVFMYVNKSDGTMTWPAPHELEYN